MNKRLSIVIGLLLAAALSGCLSGKLQARVNLSSRAGL